MITDLMSRPAPRQRIVAMTTYENEVDRHRALKAGADSYLVKGTRHQEIREAVRGAGSKLGAAACGLQVAGVQTVR